MFDLIAARLQDTLDFLQTQGFLNNSLLRWAIAVGLAVVIIVALWLLNLLLRKRAVRLAEKYTSPWFLGGSHVLKQTRSWFLLIVALYCGSLTLDLPGDHGWIASTVVIIALLIQAAIWASALLQFSIRRYTDARMEVDPTSVTTVAALGFLGRIAIWSIAALLVLDNLGVNVTAMIAGLGVGGIAIALAAQNVLGDLLASASIVLDKPFVLGDFIIVGTDMGTVENIGLKTTRLRSISGEQMIFSNNDLLQSRVRNYKRMEQRRIVFSIGVTYDTPYEKVAAIPAMLREAVEAREQVRFDRAHFKSYGDFALIYEIVYYVLTSDYAIYMDIQQAINLDIHRRFEQEGIEFAYPTQTVYLRQQGPGPA